MIYPNGCDTAAKKMEFLYRLSEKLRLDHNDKGKKFRDGDITQEVWDNFKNATHLIRQDNVSTAILEQRELLKNSKDFDPDVSEAD